MWRDPHRMRVSWQRLCVLHLLYPQINRVEMVGGAPHLPLNPRVKRTGKWWE